MNTRLEIKENNIPKLISEAKSKTETAVAKTVMDVISLSAVFTPVDTGFLIGSATPDIQGTEGWARWLAEYARYQNDGTIYISPRFFANQGAELARPGFEAAMREVFQL